MIHQDMSWQRAHMSGWRKFSSQADPEVLEEMQQLAAREGRQFQAVLAEAMRAYLANRRVQSPRRKVLEAFDESLRAHDELYRSLAK
jgi:predicted transcriptional regulator